jgi:hypothetical protein
MTKGVVNFFGLADSWSIGGVDYALLQPYPHSDYSIRLLWGNRDCSNNIAIAE